MITKCKILLLMTMTGKNGNNNSESPNLILLVDSSFILSEIKKLSNDNSSLIVSFDFKSHKQLVQNKIPHIRSEEFLSEDDIDKIQQYSYRLVYWYNESKLKNLLEYNTINFGKLFHEETMDYLVKFLKSFFEIRLIYEKYSNAAFLTSPALSETLKIFTSSIQKLSSSSVNLEIYTNDQIRVNFNLGKKYFMFFVSKSTYLKIKKLYEWFAHLIMGPKKSFNSNTKNILFVEFNTVRYEEFFLSKKPKSVNISFIGRRRPPFWNINSFSIFRKSKAKLITQYVVNQKKIELETKNGITFSKKNIQLLWQNEEFFKDFFSINNISIWDVIKPTFFELLENRIEHTVYEIELSKSILNKYRFDSIVMLSEIGFTEQIIGQLAKNHKIPVVLLQPGVYNDTPESTEMNISKGAYPIQSDKIIVWGKIAKNDCILNAKIPSNKIEIIGTPRYDKQKLSVNTLNQDYILLATSAPQPAIVHGIISKNVEDYENSIIEISKIAAKLKKPLVIKLHPSPNEPDVNALISKIDHDITVVTTGDIFHLIQSCSVMIVLGLSTAIIEAQFLHKPVISVPVIDNKLGNPEIFKSNSCIISNINSLEENLTKIFYDKKFCNNLINNANRFIENYIINLGHGPEKIFDYLSKL
jgi:hypothetical protein